MGPKAVALVAGIIDRLESRPHGPGRPPMSTLRVVEALRFFVREGVQWRELRAMAGRACGSTLRRRLDDWSATALLRRVHTALIRMVRAGPEVAALGRGRRQLFGPGQARRRADRPQSHRPRQARDQVPCRGRDRRPTAGCRSFGRQRPRHAALPASAAPGPGRLRRHRQAVRRRGLRQRREPQALPATKAFSPTSARSAKRTARGWAGSAAWSSTTARGCWPTSGWTGARTGSAASSWPS